MTDEATPRSGLIWERPEPTPRPAPVPLSRESIVQEAIAIADAEGLAGASLRGVATALGVRPMRLYGYLSTKDDLLDLMMDAVYGEMTELDSADADLAPREALHAIAHAMRTVTLRHPWFVTLAGGRPQQGPHALAHLERTLAAFAATSWLNDIDQVITAAKTFTAYVVGSLQAEMNEARAERETGMSQQQWQQATATYLHRMIDTGKFPTIATVVRNATHPPADAEFERGLQTVLAGIETCAGLPKTNRRPRLTADHDSSQ